MSIPLSRHDVIKTMGRFPDKILDENSEEMLKVKTWKCSICGEVVGIRRMLSQISPCPNCGSIFFETVREGKIDE